MEFLLLKALRWLGNAWRWVAGIPAAVVVFWRRLWKKKVS